MKTDKHENGELLSDKQRILGHIQRLFSENNQLTKGQCLNKKQILEIAALIIGCTAGVPFLSPARKFAGDNKILSIFYSVGTIGSLSVITMWSSFKFINSSKYRQTDGKNQCTSATLVAIPIILGIGSSVPGMVISYLYNNGNIAYPIISFSNDIITNTCSYYLILKQTYDIPSLKFRGLSHIKGIREQIQERFRIGMSVFVNKETSELEDFFSTFGIEKSNNNLSYEVEFLHKLISLSNDTITKRQGKNTPRLFKYTNLALSAMLAHLWFSNVFTLIYTKANGKLDSNVLSGLVALFCSVPVYMLETYSIHLIFSKMYNVFRNLYTKTQKMNFAQKNYFKTTFVLSSIALASAGFCFASRAKVFSDRYSNIYLNEILSIDVALPAAIASTIIYKASASLDFIPNFITYVLAKRGSRLAKLVNTIDGLNIALENFTAEDFKAFLNLLDIDRLLNENSHDIELTNSLNKYKQNVALPMFNLHKSSVGSQYVDLEDQEELTEVFSDQKSNTVLEKLEGDNQREPNVDSLIPQNSTFITSSYNRFTKNWNNLRESSSSAISRGWRQCAIV